MKRWKAETIAEKANKLKT